jgi:serine/threonine protein kinase/Tfp pilus assembly protein PilF
MKDSDIRIPGIQPRAAETPKDPVETYAAPAPPLTDDIFGGGDGGKGLFASLWAIDQKSESQSALPATESQGPPPADAVLTVKSDQSKAPAQPASPPPGALAPSYKLTRLIGRGGMGEVWQALQGSLNRVVAVKRIRQDCLEQFKDRLAECDRQFRQEAFATARLNHPNIVPVHDLGRDANGMPLLAMTLVRGKPWDKALEQDLIGLPAADVIAKNLPILISIAQAVAFAHSKGIVHRDLKPGQVMLGEYGEALLMDWGLSIYVHPNVQPGAPAAADAELPPLDIIQGEMPPAMTLPTRLSAVNPAGTPALMAPEQTIATAEAIGPWTDVYLLGGTLYKILTGTYPHPGVTFEEVLTRARAGQIEPPQQRTPGRDIPPELSALCMKALERNPRKRLGSALEFARKLQDYLSGASKRRESEAVAAQVAEALSGPAARKGDYAFFNERFAELSRARELWPGNPALPNLQDKALALHAALALQHGDLKLARAQADQLSGGSRHHDLFRGLEAAEARASQRERMRFVTRGLIWGMTLVLILVGSFVGLQAMAQRDAFGKRAEETQKLVEGILKDMRRYLDPADPRNSQAIDAVTQGIVAHYRDLDKTQYPANLQASLAADLNQVALILNELGRYGEAETLLRLGLDIHERVFGLAHANTIANMINLAFSLQQQGREDEAGKCYGQALEAVLQSMGPNAPLAATLTNNWALMLMQQGKHANARPLLEQAVSIWSKGLPDKPTQIDLSRGLSNLGQLHYEMGDLDGAEKYYAESAGLSNKVLDANDPDRAKDFRRYASLAIQRGRLAEAEEFCQKAAKVWENSLGTEHPDYAINLLSRAQLASFLGEFDQAAALMDRAETIFVKMLGEKHSQTIGVLAARTLLEFQKGRWDEAARLGESALEAWSQILEPSNPLIADALTRLAEIYLEQGRPEEGAASARKALALRQPKIAQQPEAPRWRFETATALRLLASAAIDKGNAAETLALTDQAMELLRPLGAQTTATPGRRRVLSLLSLERGRALEFQGHFDKAQAEWESALAMAKSAASDLPTVDNLRLQARILSRLNREDEARALWRQLAALGAEDAQRFAEEAKEEASVDASSSW